MASKKVAMDTIVGSLWQSLVGAVATSLAASGVSVPVQSVPAPEDPLVQNACLWWDLANNSGTASTLCTNTAISRFHSSSATAGLKRATECARITGESCILSHEASTHIPGIYIYEHRMDRPRMRLLVAPRVLNTEMGERHNVQITTPSSTETIMGAMYSDVEIEYFDSDRRIVAQMNLTGNDAYCVQTLMLSVGPECAQL